MSNAVVDRAARAGGENAGSFASPRFGRGANVLSKLLNSSIRSPSDLRRFVVSVALTCVLLGLSADVANQMLFFVDWPTALRSWAITVTLTLGLSIPIAANIGRAQLKLFEVTRAGEEHLLRTERLSEENFRLANRDSLTGLANRRRFLADIDAAVSSAGSGRRRVAVALLDLDGFKTVNDVYGHAGGDRLLKLVADRLRAQLPNDARLARLGGDQFGVILADAGDEWSVLSAGAALAEVLRRPFEWDGMRVQVGSSAGFAIFPSMADDATSLFDRADYALYEAKQNRRGGAVLFSAEHERAIRERGVIVQELRGADADAEFSMVHQPIVDCRLGRVIGFEALARWRSPALGEVSPGVFVPLAERYGLIRGLTPVLIRKTLAAARAWPEPLVVSFNLSPLDFAADDLVDRVADALAEAGMPARRLNLEITETALLDDFGRARRTVERLKTLGAEVSLDDFGCGYSSLAYVRRLPIDRIKIDRSFLSEIETDPASRKIFRTIVDLCRNMEIDCVAEGVETAAQLRIARDAGCRRIQGYWLARPMRASDIPAFLQQPLALGDETEPRDAGVRRAS